MVNQEVEENANKEIIDITDNVEQIPETIEINNNETASTNENENENIIEDKPAF